VRITAMTNPFGGHVDLGPLGLPVTVLWIIVICNAINLIDGLDGLAAGTGILITLMLVALLVTPPGGAVSGAAGRRRGAARLSPVTTCRPPRSSWRLGASFLGFVLAARASCSLKCGPRWRR